VPDAPVFYCIVNGKLSFIPE